MTSERLIKITLDEGSIVRWNADIDQERRVAIFDLLEQNSFEPDADVRGPYCLQLLIVENRLVFDLSSEADAPLCRIVLPTSPFRRIIRDYFQVCESYFSAGRDFDARSATHSLVSSTSSSGRNGFGKRSDSAPRFATSAVCSGLREWIRLVSANVWHEDAVRLPKIELLAASSSM